jgi:hypothetical protein
MQVQRVNQSQNFTANFARNKSFNDVLNYAKVNNCTVALDEVLHSLSRANDGTIKILDGRTPDGKIFSTFMVGKRSIANRIHPAKSPAEASYYAIFELEENKNLFRSLFGEPFKKTVSAKDIIMDYTV